MYSSKEMKPIYAKCQILTKTYWPKDIDVSYFLNLKINKNQKNIFFVKENKKKDVLESLHSPSVQYKNNEDHQYWFIGLAFVSG